MKLLAWLFKNSVLENEKIRPRELGSTLGALKPFTMATSGGMTKVPQVKSIWHARASVPGAVEADVPLRVTD